MPDLQIDGLTDAHEIGRGAFGIVYRAREAALDRDVAVKVLYSAGLDSDTRDRFDREIRAMGALSGHPNIVTVYYGGIDPEGNPYIAMEYEANGALGSQLRSGPPLAWPSAVSIGIRIAGALETAHRHHLLHRDVKPENIFLSAYNEPLLGDFGIAALVDQQGTLSRSARFSVAHVPPEALEGHPPDVSGDVYALASTVATLIRGLPPFVIGPNDPVAAVFGRIMHEPPADLRPLGVPDEVCRVLERALAKDPAERPATAEQFGKELQAAQSALGIEKTQMLVIPITDESREVSPAMLAGAIVAAPAAGMLLTGSGPPPPPGGSIPASPGGPDRTPAPPQHGRRLALLAAVLAVVVVAVAGMFALRLAGSNGNGKGATAVTTPTASASTSATPTPTPTPTSTPTASASATASPSSTSLPTGAPVLAPPIEMLNQNNESQFVVFNQTYSSGAINVEINGQTFVDGAFGSGPPHDTTYSTPMEIDFNLARQYTVFAGTVGVIDKAVVGCTTEIEILADGSVILDQTFGLGTSKTFSFNVTGVLRIQVIFLKSTNLNWCDGAIGEPTVQ